MNTPLKTRTVYVGGCSNSDIVPIGSEHPIVVQTMCNTHTTDIDATVDQCWRLARAGAQLIRITVPSMADVEALKEVRDRLRRYLGVRVPLVADVHFSPDIAMACIPVVDKIRINPGNFHADHDKARERFREFVRACRQHGRAIRIGLNHGSLGKYIVEKFGNTPEAMAEAAMEWIEICLEEEFYNVVVSLKASNTVVMVNAYRELARRMQEKGEVFPLHVGVTEAGNGDMGRIKSCVAISTLLSEGIGNTIRVSLTEPPENELPTAWYLAQRYGKKPEKEFYPFYEPCVYATAQNGHADITRHYKATCREHLLLEAACDFGPELLNHKLEDFQVDGVYIQDGAIQDVRKGYPTLHDDIMQACRRKFYKPDYIACPGCGRTMYNLQEAFEAVKAATGHLQNVVIAVMGCIVNGPGEMADADYGYVGEGAGKVTLYRKKEPVLKHIPESEAVARLVELITSDQAGQPE